MKKLLASTALVGASLFLPEVANAATGLVTDVSAIDGVNFDAPLKTAPATPDEQGRFDTRWRVAVPNIAPDASEPVLRIQPLGVSKQQPEPDARQISLQIDNDSWGVKELRDRYYTSGISAGIQTDGTQTDFVSRTAVKLLQPVARIVPQLEEGYRTYGLTAQHNIYTPERVGRRARLDDRPYAGVAVVHGAVADAGEHYARAVQVSAGVVGPWAQAQEIQTVFHAAVNRGDKPVGWGDQLRNEAFLNLSYVAANRLLEGTVAGFDYELSQNHGATIGTANINAHVGLMGKLGLGLSNILAPQMNDPMLPELNSGRVPNDNGVELFGGATVQAVGRNVTLDGNLLQESHKVEKENLVTQAFAGVSMTHQRWSLSYTYNIKSHEFKTQSAGWQHYAGVRLAYRY